KMTGMTPALFTRKGMCVAWPPYILRPTTRLAYCTGMRRCPSCTITTAATIATNSTARTIRLKRSEERRVGKARENGGRHGRGEDGIRDFHVTGVQTCALPI